MSAYLRVFQKRSLQTYFNKLQIKAYVKIRGDTRGCLHSTGEIAGITNSGWRLGDEVHGCI